MFEIRTTDPAWQRGTDGTGVGASPVGPLVAVLAIHRPTYRAVRRPEDP